MHFLVYWILSALVLLLMSRVLPGFRISGFGTALIAMLVFGLLNATLGAVLRFLTFPLRIITLGLFVLVVNAVVLKIAAAVMPGFTIRGFVPALLTALALAVLNAVIR